MFFRIAASSAAQIDRPESDSSFIKILDDRTMRDAIKKEKNAFVMFHADHLRLSDSAYFNYIKVAQEYKDKSRFFVVPASIGADVGRSYGIPGNPCLMHFRKGTKTGVHQGLMSYESIKRFVSNWTRNMLVELDVKDDASGDEILSAVQNIYPDHTLAMILFGDNTTKFGRAALELADELGVYFPFVKISNQKVAENLKARFPSLILLRFEDSMRFIYTGEPDVDDMFIWAQHYSVPVFRHLNSHQLFSYDGVAVRSAIAFLDIDNLTMQDEVFPAIGEYSNQQGWVRFYYADKNEDRALAKLFGITEFPKIVYLSANFTSLQYKICEVDDNATFTEFYEDKLTLTAIDTPSQLYNDMRPVSEFAFEKLAEEGPFFTLFTSAFCTKCKTIKSAAYDAAKTIRRNNGNVKWAMWDITKATPSFQQNISLSIPSVIYFKNNNVTEGEVYNGPPNFLSIIEWVHGKQPEAFDLDEIMNRELGGGFDDI